MATEQFYVAHGSAVIEPPVPETAGAHWPAVADPGFWHKSAPDAVRRHYSAGKAAAGWKAWRRYLRDRGTSPLARRGRKKQLLTLGDLFAAEAQLMSLGGDRPRLDWLHQVAAGGIRGKENDDEFAAAAAEHASHWLVETAGSAAWSPAAAEAWEAIVWAYALAPLAEVLPGPVWWQLAERLHQLTGRADIAVERDPLAHQFAAGEFPWTLAGMFPELGPCQHLAHRARKGLSGGVAEILDGDGLPQSAYLAAFPRLVACWTRCRISASQRAGNRAGRPPADNCWDDDAEQQFPLAIREALRLSRTDGTAVFSSQPQEPAEGEGRAKTARSIKAASAARLAELAVRLIDDKKPCRTIRAILAARSRGADSKSIKSAPSRLPKPAVHSEWAELAVLQTDWSRQAVRLTVAYGEAAPRIELEADRELLLSGPWELEVSLSGVPAAAAGHWEEVCWETDADADYLELEIQLTGGVRVQRQMLLSRSERFLFLADAVLTDGFSSSAVPAGQPAELSYRSRLPLASGIAVHPAAETRDLSLAGRKPSAIVLPLALPEWRTDPRGGTLAKLEDASALELRQSCRGQRLYAPLWIDLCPKRAKRPFTWRQLTVAEQLQNQPRDVAAGYRVQFGKRQWLIYRSLAKAANRTLLGVNLSTEFLLARFGRDGEIETVLEIE